MTSRPVGRKRMKRIYSGFMAAILAAGMMTTPALAADYQDIQDHWGKAAIEQVSEWGLFGGIGDNLFAPDMTMTRGMFVTVLARTAQHLEVYQAPEKQADFADVAQTDYFADGVAWAQENGLVNGMDAAHFAPNDQITREQMCLIMTRFLTNVIKCDLTPYQETENTFLDKESIHDYALPSVNACVALGLIKGVPVAGGLEFQPAQPASRAAAAVVLQNQVTVIREMPATPETAPDGGTGGGGGGTGGGGGGEVTPPDHTAEEIAEEKEVAGYLKSMLKNYRSSSYLLTTEQPVQDAMALLMDCIADALDQRDDGQFLDRSFIREEYSGQISQLRRDYKALTKDQRNQLNNVIVRLGDTEAIYTVMDYFGVEMD